MLRRIILACAATLLPGAATGQQDTARTSLHVVPQILWHVHATPMAGAQLEVTIGSSAWRPALAISVGGEGTSSFEATYLRIPSSRQSAAVYWGVDAGVVRDDAESDPFAGARVGAELFNQPGGALRIELHLHLFEDFARLAAAAGVRL